MDLKLIISRFLEELLSEVRNLSANDIATLESDSYSISLKIKINKGKGAKTALPILKLEKNEILKQLQTIKTRDGGYKLISEHLKTKKEFEDFARYLEVSVSKQDKSDQIKEKIVEATIGATLRSNAIQGKKV